MDLLTIFWLKFDFDIKTPHPIGTLLGCGVTAYDYNDAIQLLRKYVFESEIIPNVTECIENVDISTLDEKHIRPNMGNPVVRGIWFPQVEIVRHP